MQEPGPQCPVLFLCWGVAAALALPASPRAQDKRADQTDSQAQRLVLLSPLSFLKSPQGGGFGGRKGPEVAARRLVLGQQVRGEEGLPVEAETDRLGGSRAQEAESREADAGGTT